MELDQYLALQNNRKKPHKQEEAQIQMRIAKYLRSKYPNVLFTSTLGGIRTSIGQAVKLKRLGYTNGVPDLLIFQPKEGYHGLFIEVKTEKGVLSQAQKEFLKALHDKDYSVFIAYGYDSAVKAIDTYLTKRGADVKNT